MIDNLERISPLLSFDSEDDFYFLQILQRKKDNLTQSCSVRVIKEYFINNLNYLNEHYNEIKKLCVIFNARAVINLNRRSFRKTALSSLSELAKLVSQDSNYRAARRVYASSCGKKSNESSKKWIVDVDNCTDASDMEDLKSYLSTLAPVGEKVLLTLPTKSGFHLITTPFRVDHFKRDYDHDIHKDNPVNLFIA